MKKGLKAELTQHTEGNSGGRRRTLKQLPERPSYKEYSGSHRPLWRSHFGIDYGPNCRKTMMERQKEDEDEEEDVSSHWIKLGTRNYWGNWNTKQEIDLCGELALEWSVVQLSYHTEGNIGWGWGWRRRKQLLDKRFDKEINLEIGIRSNRSTSVEHSLWTGLWTELSLNTEEMKEGRWGRGRRHKQLLDKLLDKKSFWKLKCETTDRPLWRTRFGRDYGPKCCNTDNIFNVSYYCMTIQTARAPSTDRVPQCTNFLYPYFFRQL